MPQIRKSVLVLHTAQQMFDLVDAIENYPRFLPWCGKSEVLSRNAGVTVATLRIDYLGIKSAFTTQNHNTPGAIAMTLKEGPFEQLSGGWRFIALSDEACKVEFELDYTFSSRTLEKVIGPVFSVITGTLVDAFIREADRKYG